MNQDDSAARKRTPIYSGFVRYFPRAMAAVARHSFASNNKHNPGEPLHWAKGKSTDQADCAFRHQMTPYQVDAESGELHLTAAAWRNMAWLEITLQSLELGLCTLSDLESGRADIATLGKLIAELEAREAEQ